MSPITNRNVIPIQMVAPMDGIEAWLEFGKKCGRMDEKSERNKRGTAIPLYIAMPPTRAVGFLCHLSVVGCAIHPFFRAITRTTGVAITQMIKDTIG